MAIQAPDGLAGIHLNFLRRPPLEVVAVLLGSVLASEPVGVATIAAMVIILVGVALVNSGQSSRHEAGDKLEPETEEAVA